LPYITVPVLLHYHLKKTSIFAGGEFGYKLKSTSKAGQSRKENLTLTHPIDIGLTGGVGYRLSDDHTITLRYTHGLVNVIGKDVTMRVFGEPSLSLRENGYGARNRTIQLSLSTTFRYKDTNERKRKVNFDFRQGIARYSVFTMEDDGISHFESDKKTTYEAALEMNVQIKKYFQFNTGINYVKKTSELMRFSSFDYLTVPLLFGVSPIVTDDFRLSIQGGLGVNFMVNERNDFRPTYSPADETNDINTSFIYGVEGQIPLKKKLSLLLVYRNSWDNDGAFRFNYADLKFRGYSMSAGIRYHLNTQSEEKPSSDQYEEIAEGTGSRFGLKTGLNFHWLSSNSKPEFLVINENSAMPYWHAGVFYNIRLGNTLSLVPELTYTKRSTSLPSLDLPVTLSRRMGKKLSLEAGPQMVFFFDKPQLESRGPYQMYVSKLTDFGVTAGARYQIFKNLELSARYFNGLTDTAGLLTDNGESVSFAGFNRTVMLSTYITLVRKK
jgi:hypothetical protein